MLNIAWLENVRFQVFLLLIPDREKFLIGCLFGASGKERFVSFEDERFLIHWPGKGEIFFFFGTGLGGLAIF